ncbi:glycosyltransferase [Candidatus Woesearchaeota archaeon]|nr:glycosyltransferase [Candidatus Woesearchaeota archaeon]
MVKSNKTNRKIVQVTAIITSFNEPSTVAKAVKSIKESIKEYSNEIIVVAPDQPTLSAAKIDKTIKIIQDNKKGKPAALNMAFKKAKGQILILTDGDVYTKDAHLLLVHFKNPLIGAVTGRPISLSPKNTKLGYWSHLLTDAAHKRRLIGGYLDCSGYLYAIRNTISIVPEDALSEDAVISQLIFKYGYIIRYEPRATAYVKYPTTYSDWLIQKIRSAGGYVQIKKYIKKPVVMRNISTEVFQGTTIALAYPKRLVEFWWTFLLFIARIHMWILIYINQNRDSRKIWKRVESTK